MKILKKLTILVITYKVSRLSLTAKTNFEVKNLYHSKNQKMILYENEGFEFL